VQITIPYRLADALRVFELTSFAIEELGFTAGQFRSGAKPKLLDGRDHFGFSGSVFSDYSYSPIGNHDVGIVFLKGTIQISHASAIVDALVDDLDVIQAHIHDGSYYHWQNAFDLLQFSAANRSIDGLKLIDNGLPPPLNQMVVDTSSNPGRRFLRRGFQEAVSSPMWLSKGIDGVSVDVEALNDSGFSTSDRGSHVVITDSEQPYSEKSNAEQELLRRLVFE